MGHIALHLDRIRPPCWNLAKTLKWMHSFHWQDKIAWTGALSLALWTPTLLDTEHASYVARFWWHMLFERPPLQFLQFDFQTRSNPVWWYLVLLEIETSTICTIGKTPYCFKCLLLLMWSCMLRSASTSLIPMLPSMTIVHMSPHKTITDTRNCSNCRCAERNNKSQTMFALCNFHSLVFAILPPQRHVSSCQS